MVGYPNDVAEVWQGFLNAARPGCLIIDMTTSSPALARQLAAAATAKGCLPLDAPVSGGDRGAREGTMTIMVGGEAAAFEQARPLFEAMGKDDLPAGRPGRRAALQTRQPDRDRLGHGRDGGGPRLRARQPTST